MTHEEETELRKRDPYFTYKSVTTLSGTPGHFKPMLDENDEVVWVQVLGK